MHEDQNGDIIPTGLGSNPREGKNAHRPGKYALITRLTNSVVNRGNIFKLQVFISGYGDIENAKVSFYSSTDLLDEQRSKVHHGVKLDAQSNTYKFGGTTNQVDNIGVTLDLSNGISLSRWYDNQPTYFWDVRGTATPHVSTEMLIDKAPVEFDLAVSINTPPGKYDLFLNLTYFNGQEWNIDKAQIPITVNNTFQQYETWFAWLAFAFAIVSTFAAVLGGIVDFLDIFFKK